MIFNVLAIRSLILLSNITILCSSVRIESSTVALQQFDKYDAETVVDWRLKSSRRNADSRRRRQVRALSQLD